MGRYNTTEDYWKKVNKSTPTGCWEWLGSKCRDGYGLFKMNKQSTSLAHRWAIILNNQDPTDKVVLHTCDNTSCVNPNHLRLGSQTDNVKDMHSKGRYRSKPRSLSDEEVRAIRSSTETYVKIGKRFDISNNYAWKIKKRIAYKDVI